MHVDHGMRDHLFLAEPVDHLSCPAPVVPRGHCTDIRPDHTGEFRRADSGSRFAPARTTILRGSGWEPAMQDDGDRYRRGERKDYPVE
jgi:hypothetical protein